MREPGSGPDRTITEASTGSICNSADIEFNSAGLAELTGQ